MGFAGILLDFIFLGQLTPVVCAADVIWPRDQRPLSDDRFLNIYYHALVQLSLNQVDNVRLKYFFDPNAATQHV